MKLYLVTYLDTLTRIRKGESTEPTVTIYTNIDDAVTEALRDPDEMRIVEINEGKTFQLQVETKIVEE